MGTPELGSCGGGEASNRPMVADVWVRVRGGARVAGEGGSARKPRLPFMARTSRGSGPTGARHPRWRDLRVGMALIGGSHLAGSERERGRG